jgi:hypothetical protein
LEGVPVVKGHYPLTLVAKSRPNLDPRPRGLPD